MQLHRVITMNTNEKATQSSTMNMNENDNDIMAHKIKTINE